MNPYHLSGNQHPDFKGYGELNLRKFSSLQREADRRKILFQVTVQELWELFLKQDRKCALSGIELSLGGSSKSNRYKGTASLDRIDSKIGYELNNVQWVHKDINMMKQSLSQDEFINFCRLIVEYNK